MPTPRTATSLLLMPVPRSLLPRALPTPDAAVARLVRVEGLDDQLHRVAHLEVRDAEAVGHLAEDDETLGQSTAASANGTYGSVVGMYGAGGLYCASVYDHTLPKRDSSTSSNSSPEHAGFLQKVVSRGNEIVPQDRHLVPIRAGSGRW